ncbi:unnamed protein product [Gordionus sp. m RMFG-2023]|uniref:cAMP-dependent protein kinase type II regulatory subunit-like n=1 Tax=Gordionus sp. m RMFG-2023 TaxID=3053472 RepID=UPI0030DFB9A8
MASQSREEISHISRERRKSVFTEPYDPEEDPDPQNRVVYPKTAEQREKIKSAITETWLLKTLESDEIEEVIDAIYTLPVKKGDKIIEQGQPGENFYIIESGNYDVYVAAKENVTPSKKVSSYIGTGSFGEIALLCNLPRTATVVATSNGSLWAVDRQTFRRIVIRRAYEKREYHKELLNGCSLFKTLKDYEQFKILDAFDIKRYKVGDLILSQGDNPDGMYFIKEGVVKIIFKDGTTKKDYVLATLKKNDYFGEMALLNSKPRSASAVAQTSVTTAFLATDDFERLLGSCKEIMMRNVKVYEENMKKAVTKPGA